MLFWTFSNKVYRVEGVADACLKLQDSFGMDVNMVLFCCWYGLSYGAMDSQLLQQSLEFSRVWSAKTVIPIREIRIWLKDTGCADYSFDAETCMRFRDRIKAIELEAEKIQQHTLESLCREKAGTELPTQAKIEAVAKNLRYYLGANALQPTKPIIRELESILQAGLADFDSETFRKTLSN